MVEPKLDGIFGREYARARVPAGKIPAAQAFQISERSRAVVRPTRAFRFTQQIEVVTNQPDHSLGDETLEEVSAYFVVDPAFDCFAHVVKKGGCPQFRIIGCCTRLFEDLERVEERVALGMIAHGLSHATQAFE